MLAYVLTIVKDNILDNCEVFDTQDAALQSAIETCDYFNITKLDSPAWDSKIPGWVVADKNGYFVSVVQRPVRANACVILASYAGMLDKIAGNTRLWQDGNYSYTVPLSKYFPNPIATPFPNPFPDPFVSTLPVTLQADRLDAGKIPPYVNTKPQITGRDANDGKLPGGFSWGDTPLLMEDIFGGLEHKSTFVLSEEQKWSLVTARLLRTPDVLFTCDKHVYAQHLILDALNARTELGLKIRKKELDMVQAIYDLYEEYSSSSSEELDDESDL